MRGCRYLSLAIVLVGIVGLTADAATVRRASRTIQDGPVGEGVPLPPTPETAPGQLAEAPQVATHEEAGCRNCGPSAGWCPDYSSLWSDYCAQRRPWGGCGGGLKTRCGRAACGNCSVHGFRLGKSCGPLRTGTGDSETAGHACESRIQPSEPKIEVEVTPASTSRTPTPRLRRS